MTIYAKILGEWLPGPPPGYAYARKGVKKVGSLKLRHWKCNTDYLAFTVLYNWLGGACSPVVLTLWYAKAFKVVRETLLFFYTKRRHFVFPYRVLL